MHSVKNYLASVCFALAVTGVPHTASAQQACEDAELVESGKLIVAYPGDMPMTTLKEGKLAGTDGDIVNHIADRLGLQVEPQLIDWAGLIESVKSRRTDMMVSSVGWTKARTEAMAMTDPIYYTGALMTQRKADNVTKLEQLAEKRIGTIQGFSWIPELKAINPDVKLYDTSEAAVRDLAAGRVDVLFLDPMLAQYATTTDPSLDFKSIAVTDSFDPKRSGLTSKYHTVIGMSKEAPKLSECVNAIVRDMWRTCENRKILATYGFGDDLWFIPPTVKLRNGVDRDAVWASPELGICN